MTRQALLDRADIAPVSWGLDAPPPDSYSPPRLISPPHPDAVGSYGPECIALTESSRMQPRRSAGTRYFQRVALARALEHDAAGRLCWPVVLISTPRQTGKSWVERMACWWRLRQAERFGEAQTILHVAHLAKTAYEVWRPASYAAIAEGYNVRRANGEQMIETPDGSRWLLQAATDGAGVGFSLSMALVDEAWQVPRRVYDDAISPTLAESASAQGWLVSTAGESASDLMMAYRNAALADIDAGRAGDVLLLEWSAPPDPDLDLDDPRVQRAATPHWSAERADVMRRARLADELAYRRQMLNQWVPSAAPALVQPARWELLATGREPGMPVAFGIDVSPDRAYGCVAWHGDGVGELAAVGPSPADQAPPPGAGAAWIVPWLLERAGRFGGQWTVAVDMSGPAAPLGEQLHAALGERVLRVSGRDAASAAGLLHDRMTAAPVGIALRQHPYLQAAVLGARWRSYGQTRAFSRDESAGASGVPLVAMSLAVWAGERAPSSEPPAVF